MRQTEAVAMHTPKEWPIVYMSPAQHAVEVFAEGEFPDPNPHLIMTDGLLGRVIEDEVAQVGVGIQTPQIRGKQGHEHAVCPQGVTGLLQFNGIEDGVRIGRKLG
ncbi:MAG: hypothetical protein WCO26_08345, partial [Deltaproteobacteria bacterium]